MKVNEIRIVFPDGIDIPDSYEPIADVRRITPNDAYIDNSTENCVQFWSLKDNSHYRYPVLRRKWQAPERFRGSGLWLWDSGGIWYLSIDEPQLNGSHGLFQFSGPVMFIDEFTKALGLTPDALPDWTNTPPSERKVQM